MKKRFLLTSVLMLLLTVLALGTSTYAWFSMSSTTKVNEFTFKAVDSSDGLEISGDASNFGAAATISADDLGNPTYDLAADKTTKLYSSANEGATLNAVTLSDGVYNEFKIYFRTKSYGDIKLDLANSYIVPEAYKDEIKDGDGNMRTSSAFVTAALAAESDAADDEAIVNKSTAGDFSKDWIAAAMRASFVVTGYYTSAENTYSGSHPIVTDDEDDAYNYQEPVFVDALRTAKISYNQITGNASMGSSSAQTGYKFVAEDNGSLVASTTEGAQTYDVNELLTSGSVTIATIYTGEGNLQWSQGDYALVEVTVKLWVEGQDSEAVLPLTAGSVAAAFQFKLDNAAYEDPTDYRTVVSFTAFNANEDGFTWAVATAGLDTTYGIKIVKDATVDATTVAGLTSAYTVDMTKAFLEEELEAGTYTIVAKVSETAQPASGKWTGYKHGTDANTISVAKGTTPETYDYYVIKTFTISE